MSEQEMEFADPDWQPSGPLPVQQRQEEQAFVPQPVNTYHMGSPQSEVEISRAQGYRGQDESMYAPPVMQPVPALRQRRRSGWGGWFLILILIIMATTFWGNRQAGRGGFSQSPFPQKALPVFTHVLQDASQIQVDDPNGSITVQVSPDAASNRVSVQSDNADSGKVLFSENKGVLTIALADQSTSDSADLTITLPQNLALNLSTVVGNVEVDGFNGQASIKTDSGIITLNKDSFSSQSLVSTNSGDVQINDSSFSGTYTVNNSGGSVTLDHARLSGRGTIQAGGDGSVTFVGTLDSSGTYQFITDKGLIDLTLPPDTAMQLLVPRGTGNFNSDFPGNAGSGSQASVTLKSNSGDISVHKQ